MVDYYSLTCLFLRLGDGDDLWNFIPVDLDVENSIFYFHFRPPHALLLVLSPLVGFDNFHF